MNNEPLKSIEEQPIPSVISIMLADDHPFIRQALKILLESEPDLKIIAEASNGAEAVELATKLHPDVVIMDIGMPVMNGLEATRQIKEKCPDVAILVLTVFTDNQHVLGILNAGAAGYLTKEVFGDEVTRAIRAIIAGEAVLTPSILHQIIESMPQPAPKPGVTTFGRNFSAREYSILKMIAKGMCNKDIASELNINVRTVKGNLTTIFNKLGVSSRTESVVTGLKSGLLTINDLG
jgi:two-component system, NarL family, response regulator LiaR